MSSSDGEVVVARTKESAMMVLSPAAMAEVVLLGR